MALGNGQLALRMPSGRAMPRVATTTLLRAACSVVQALRRTLSKPRLNEPTAQKPVTIVPSARPTTNERSSTSSTVETR